MNALPKHDLPAFVVVDPDEPKRIRLRDLMGVLLRQKLIIIAVIAIGIGLAAAYVVTAPRYYTAQVTMLIDAKRGQLFRAEGLAVDPVMDTPAIESQIETLKSDNVIAAVIKNLNLLNDPEFTGPSRNPISMVMSWIGSFFGPSVADTEERRMLRALGRFKLQMQVQRVGLSLAISASFTSLSAEKSAAIANEIAEAFTVEQLESKFQLTSRTGTWLQTRINDLSLQASAAERRMIDFKAQNQLIDSSGRLISEQQMTDLNTQLSVARSQAADARARLDRIREVVQGGVPDASMTDALRSETLIKLRQEYLELVRRESDLSARFGPNHQQTILLRTQMRSFEGQMRDELKRLEEAYKSDFEIARLREEAVGASLEGMMRNLVSTRQAQVTLRELESAATTARALHDAFLQKYQLALQQQSFPISDARTITMARAPNEASSPRTVLILAGALIFSFGIGVSVALARELLDTRIRTAAELASIANVECFGLLPREKGRVGRALAGLETQLQTNAAQLDGAPTFSIVRTRPEVWTALRKPFSMFAETIRSVIVAIDVARISGKMKRVAVISNGQGEGKTTTSINIAAALAHSGLRVLLIDGDLRSPSLTRVLTPDAQVGLLEVLGGTTKLKDAIWQDKVTGLLVLPTVLSIKPRDTNRLLSSAMMDNLLTEAEGFVDYIIIDTAPFGPVVDVKAVAHLVDGFILCAAWGRTTRLALSRLPTSGFLGGKIVGGILTMVDVSTYRKFTTYDDSYYSEDAA
jgi:succinoglycan biosynthesis transport protein ExoP